MINLSLSPIPSPLTWKNDPVTWTVESGGILSITAGPRTDWFIEPSGSDWVTSSAPSALFTPDKGDFLLSAQVTVNFASKFDAGVLFLYERDNLWGKLCFEYSPQGKPMIVSVITRGLSDDCNSVVIEGKTVYLRVARLGQAFVYHYSTDGKVWHMVRYFTLGPLENPQVGFLAQSPTGEGCKVTFAEIAYRRDTLKDMRNGE